MSQPKFLRILQEHPFSILGMTVAAIAGFIAVTYQFGILQQTGRLELQRTILATQRSELLSVSEIRSLVRAELTSYGNIDSIVVAEKFAALEKKVQAADDRTLAIRQSINPMNPEEVLKIARLTDEVKDLREDFSGFRKQVEDSQQTFKASILRELKTSSDSTTLILVVLVPLILNFLYTVSRDLKTGIKRDEAKG